MRSISASRLTVASSILLFLISTQSALGQVRWRSGTVELTEKEPAEIATVLTELAARPDKSRIVVQFDEPVSLERRARLSAAGLNLLDYLGDFAFFASLSEPALNPAALAATPSFKRVAAVERDWKLHPDLVQGQIHEWTIVGQKDQPQGDGNPTVGAYVLFHPDVVLDPDAVAIARLHGARIRSKLESINGLVIELPYDAIATLADHDAVKWIEPPLPKFSELNNDNRLRVGADIVQAAPYGLDGSGVTVLVYDGGFGLSSHQDFGGRLTVRDSSGLSDHSTHVAATVGGSGAASGGTFKGMAPGVTIQSYGFEQEGGLQQGFLYTDPGDLEDDYNEAINTFGADISNNSIGTNTAPNGYPCEWEGNYGVTGALIDAIAAGSLGAPFRIVWANGNERGSGRCGTTYLTTAPPACAKNHITVGAMNSNNDSVTSFTSWGPTDDGRIKPDISGPGCQSSGDFTVTSASSSGGYTGKCGTSMASPTVCGVGALILQDFRAQYPGEPDFRNSTLKALLATTAEDIESTGPDYRSGYGSVRVQPAIELMRAGNFLEDSVDQGQVFSVLVVVGPGDSEFKVTLAWDDVPGTPDVMPVLVNDLDLEVFDGSNTQHFPWTLDPNNPSAAAVRTQVDHVNNIEQVVIDSPTPGVYRVDVRGFNVPSGPQSFSIVASPLLIACSQTGIVSLDRNKYACSSTATIRVVDCDLNTDDGLVETIPITIVSDSEPAGETITLTETAAETAAFEATISLSETDAVGILLIANGDAVSVTYTDADDGLGGINVDVTTNAVVDCTPPIISNVQTIDVEPRSATVTFDTDENANGLVRYATSCPPLTDVAVESGFNTAHAIDITGLDDDTTYFYSTEATDEAANQAANNNGGNCYSFTTLEIPDFFTEEFTSGFDLDNLTILFSPNGGDDFYDACVEPITDLPTDPAGGTTIVLTDDDSELQNLTGGETVSLYGVSYAGFFVGSNGYITLGASDTDYSETLSEHFELPRVAALYDDLNPSTGGTVSWLQLADRAVVTYEDVPEYSTTNQNTFQFELYFNGDIRVSYLGIAVADCIAGLSEGNGLSPDFFESDLSSYGNCGPKPPKADPVNAAVSQNAEITIDLVATDDGLPDPPAALSYIIATLPNGELRDAGDDQVILSVPHTLIGGGNQVLYAPGAPGADGFQYKANDGGVPPEGGDSNIGVVSIQVEPVLTLPFFDDFPAASFDANKWALVSGAEIDGIGIAEPSEPNSARFNGDPAANDEIQTYVFDLSGQTSVTLSYYWEQTGGGNSPDDNDDLYVEFLDAFGRWNVVHKHLGSGPDMSTYLFEEVILPAAAYHSEFRLRIRCTGTQGPNDDWFVDNVGLSGDCPFSCGDVDGSGGTVNLQDFATFALCFGGLPSSSQGCACSDLNGNGAINLEDFATFSLAFGGISSNALPNCP